MLTRHKMAVSHIRSREISYYQYSTTIYGYSKLKIMPLVLTFPQFPQFTATIYKFHNVSNSLEIKNELLKGNSLYDFAFITAKVIISIEQLSSAIYRTILDHSTDKIRTRTLHSEIIFSLSQSSNIGEALRSFGIQNDDKDLVIVKISNTNEDYHDYVNDLNNIINGDQVDVNDEEFAKSVDYKIIKKNYKITSQDVDEITRQVVNFIQLRGH